MTTRCQQFECLTSAFLYNGSVPTTAYVQFFAAGTANTKNVWPDAEKSGSAFTKAALGSDGRLVAFGDGIYDVKFYLGDPDDGYAVVKTLEDLKVEAVIGIVSTLISSSTITPDYEIVRVDTSSGDITVSLQTAENYSHPIVFIKTSASNTITFEANGSETINNQNTIFSTSLYGVTVLYPKTSTPAWYAVEEKPQPGIYTITATTESITRHEHEGRPIIMAETGGDAAATYTLPAATGSGSRYLFIVGVVNTSNYIIKVDSASATMSGNIITNSTGDTPDLAQPWPTAAASDTITLNGTTTGGVAIGDWVELIDIAANKWAVRGVTTSSGAEATPFSAGVS